MRILRVGFALLMLKCVSPAYAAEEQSDRREAAGLKLFTSVVAADLELAEKTSADGQLHIVLLYREDPVPAEQAAKRLAETKSIGKLRLQFSTLPYARLAGLHDAPPAALYIAEWSPDDLPRVVRFGIDHHRVVFSPFSGDVEAGVQAGIHVADRLLPLVNTKALQAAHVRLKPFFLEVAKTYE